MKGTEHEQTNEPGLRRPSQRPAEPGRPGQDQTEAGAGAGAGQEPGPRLGLKTTEP